MWYSSQHCVIILITAKTNKYMYVTTKPKRHETLEISKDKNKNKIPWHNNPMTGCKSTEPQLHVTKKYKKAYRQSTSKMKEKNTKIYQCEIAQWRDIEPRHICNKEHKKA